jgi:hypothetical protein
MKETYAIEIAETFTYPEPQADIMSPMSDMKQERYYPSNISLE